MQNKNVERYLARGVSSVKGDVYAAIDTLDKGIFPTAFCKVIPDICGDPHMCTLMHSDDVGTKTSLAYLAWLEGMGEAVWHGVAQDCIVMNLDDCACVGALGPFWVTNTIARNAKRISGSVIKAIVDGYSRFIGMLNAEGLSCSLVGGETSDCGDVVRTIFMDSTVVTRLARPSVIDASHISPGDVIVSFSSSGQARWEIFPNSGIGSNGLTSARHQLLAKEYYEKYPETYAPEVDPSLIYCGGHRLGDALPGDPQFTIAEALLSPTRTYLPLLMRIFSRLPSSEIHALIHCTGGGQTKILRYGGTESRGLRYVKNNLLPTPEVFKALAESSGQDAHEMYKIYNMGALMEAVVPEHNAKLCIEAAEECGIAAVVCGFVEEATSQRNEVVICVDDNEYRYSL